MAARRWWLGLLYGPALAAGAAEAPPVAPAPYDLVCWQAGQAVTLERGIAADSVRTVAGSLLRKTDGSALLLVAPQEVAGPCLLRPSTGNAEAGPNENGEPSGSPSQHRQR